ncbi:hypothetical protein [Mucilaginibacter ginsenosidivorans]|uniref:ApeI dehydratase-like domain-containing protein n=1 Tax=Mucilaginibacter ginsenosidivorans TaxID=398053 RepID=A0A5B8USY6_9SPHI|nr:hypothetical protein [Mucilaginibacter ginsenosidivorans]QEC62220.1 hypothetical protein FRZ54_06350 [Mucilaginibacter ginsenosidivorans]
MPVNNNDLFHVLRIDKLDGMIVAKLGIDRDSEILKGHFPGHPVVPGACMLQVVKDVLEDSLGTTLRLKKADHLKFMSLVDPTERETVQLEIVYRDAGQEETFVTAKVSADENICFKLQCTFVKI